jgi:hypothetical protein
MRREVLGAEVPKSTRETQPLGVRFRATLGEETRVELALA